MASAARLSRWLSLFQAYQEQMENSASEILEKIEPLRCAAKGEAEKLGHAVGVPVLT